MGRGIGKADGARSEQGIAKRGYASKGDRGKLQETLLEDSPLGRRAADGWGEVSSHALHGAMRNILELCRELTEKTFFLGFRQGNTSRVPSILHRFFGGNQTRFNEGIQARIDRAHSVPTPDFHNADNLLHPASP